jgi:hypothetical protein
MASIPLVSLLGWPNRPAVGLIVSALPLHTALSKMGPVWPGSVLQATSALSGLMGFVV